MKHIYPNLFFIFVFILLFNSPLGYAQTDNNLHPIIKNVLPEAEILPDVRLQKKSHPEKILFTQLKLSKTQPNIDSYAQSSPYVQKAQDIDKQAVILSEYNRIGNSFNLHDEAENIVVHVSLEADEYSSLQNLIVFDELDEKTFFRFQMYNQNIGIVPEEIQKFSKLQLSKVRAERFFQAIEGSSDVVAELVLKPVYADRKESFEMDGAEFWLMFARIAEFRLWSDDNPDNAQLLWFYHTRKVVRVAIRYWKNVNRSYLLM